MNDHALNTKARIAGFFFLSLALLAELALNLWLLIKAIRQPVPQQT